MNLQSVRAIPTTHLLILLLCICTIIVKLIATTTLANFSAKQKKASSLSPPVFQIASWNLRVPFPTDALNGHAWSSRMPYIAKAISEHRPDILGLQEDCHFMNMDLLSYKNNNLSNNYERYGLFNRNGESQPSNTWPENAFTRDGMKDGEHNSIWWRKDRFKCLDTHSFWLSEHPDVAGSSVGEVTGRVVNCVLLTDVLYSEKRVVAVCSTHMPANDIKIEVSIDVLAKQLQRWRQTSNIRKPMILFVLGDFNFNPSSLLYTQMKHRGFFDTRSDTVLLKGDNVNVTANDWYKPFNQILDYIWIFEDTTPSLVQIHSLRHISVHAELSKESNVKNVMWTSMQTASDHLMVLANVSWI